MDKKIALEVAIEAVRHVLGEAEGNLYRWKLHNSFPNRYSSDHTAQAHWQGCVDTYRRTIEILEGLKHDGAQ